MNSDKQFMVVIMHRATNKPTKETGPFAARRAEQVRRGVSRNLNQEEYTVVFKLVEETDEDKD